MALLSKAQILTQKPLTRDVEVPEWGGSVRLKASTLRDNIRLMDIMTIREREIEEYEADQLLPIDDRRGIPRVERFDDTLIQILMAVVDENDEPLFDPFTDYEQMLGLSFASISLLFGHVVNMRAAQKPVEPIDDVKKNS